MIGPGRRRRPSARTGRRFRLHHVLVVLSLAVLALAAPLRAPASENGSFVHPAVWRIHNKGYTSTATAFAVAPNRFVTNAHVVGDLLALGSREVFLTRDGNPERLTVGGVLALSVTFDLAHLETRENVAHHLELAAGVSRTHSDWLTVHGYPEGSLRVLEQAAKIAYEDGLSLGLAVNGEGLFALSGAPALDPEGKVALVVHSANANFLLGVKAQNVQGVRSRTSRGGLPPGSLRGRLHREGDRPCREAGRNRECAGAPRARLDQPPPDEGRVRGRDQAPLAAQSRGARPARCPGEAGLRTQGRFAGPRTRIPRKAYKWFRMAASGNSPAVAAPGIACLLWREGRSPRRAFRIPLGAEGGGERIQPGPVQPERLPPPWSGSEGEPGPRAVLDAQSGQAWQRARPRPLAQTPR